MPSPPSSVCRGLQVGDGGCTCIADNKEEGRTVLWSQDCGIRSKMGVTEAKTRNAAPKTYKRLILMLAEVMHMQQYSRRPPELEEHEFSVVEAIAVTAGLALEAEKKGFRGLSVEAAREVANFRDVADAFANQSETYGISDFEAFGDEEYELSWEPLKLWWLHHAQFSLGFQCCCSVLCFLSVKIHFSPWSRVINPGFID